NEISYVAIDTRARHLNRGTAPKNVRRMSVVSASGILIDPKRHWSLTHYARLPEECTLDEIADSSGEWTPLAGSSATTRLRSTCFSAIMPVSRRCITHTYRALQSLRLIRLVE